MAYQGNNQNRSGGFNNNRPNGNQGQQRSGGFDKPKFDMPLELNYNEDENLFDTTAQKWAEAISGTKKTQARNFYDKVLELEQKAQNEIGRAHV